MFKSSPHYLDFDGLITAEEIKGVADHHDIKGMSMDKLAQLVDGLKDLAVRTGRASNVSKRDLDGISFNMFAELMWTFFCKPQNKVNMKYQKYSRL